MRYTNRLITETAAAFIVPTRTSSRAGLWLAGYRVLQAPLATVGTARRYRATLDGGDVSVVCVGRPARFRGLLTRVLGGRVQLEAVSRRWPLWSPSIPWPKAPLIAVEIHPLLARKFRSAGWLICPEMVRWQGSLDRVPPARPKKSLRSDLAQAKRNAYRLQVAAGSSDEWDQFRQTMLIPYAERRFGEGAWILPEASLRQIAARGGQLLFLMKGDRRIAGVCVLCTGAEVWMTSLGVSGGEVSLMREGALVGLYALMIEWARDLGLRRVDLGRTSAFERDGLARYKRKWGLSPVREPLSNLVALRVDPADRSLQAAIEREPFWIEPGDGRLEVYPGAR